MHHLPESNYPPALQEKARRIATTGRIVLTELVPERWVEEVEYRLFLAALGELIKDRPHPTSASDLL